jgi:DNA-binding transcriptional regulator YiaG
MECEAGFADEFSEWWESLLKAGGTVMARSFNTLREKMSPQRQEQAKERTNEMLEELALQDLRKALNLTQEQVAIIMKTNQAAASRMENQSDIYVSTLRKFIRALGGEIKIVATFKDREVVINQFQQG